METYKNETLNANDFLGNFLVKEDISDDMQVTLTDVRAAVVRDASRRKLIATFAEFEKPLILNSTNIKRLCDYFDTTNAKEWRGRLTLYVDENIEYAGKAVGGIRLRASGQIPIDVSEQLPNFDFRS